MISFPCALKIIWSFVFLFDVLDTITTFVYISVVACALQSFSML